MLLLTLVKDAHEVKGGGGGSRPSRLNYRPQRSDGGLGAKDYTRDATEREREGNYNTSKHQVAMERARVTVVGTTQWYSVLYEFMEM